MKKAQTSIEYLLLAGGVIVVALLVGAYTLNAAKSVSNQISSAAGNINTSNGGGAIQHQPAVTCTYNTSGDQILIRFSCSDPDGNLKELNINISGDEYLSKEYAISGGSDTQTETITVPADGKQHTYDVKATVGDSTGLTGTCEQTIVYSYGGSSPSPSGSPPTVSCQLELQPDTKQPIVGYTQIYDNLTAQDPDGDLNAVTLKVYDTARRIVYQKTVPIANGKESNIRLPLSDKGIVLPHTGTYYFNAVVSDKAGHTTQCIKQISAISSTTVEFNSCAAATEYINTTARTLTGYGETVVVKLAPKNGTLDAVGYVPGKEYPSPACIYAANYDYRGKLIIDFNNSKFFLSRNSSYTPYTSLILLKDVNGVTLTSGNLDCASKWDTYGDRNACVLISDSNVSTYNMSIADFGDISSANGFYAVPLAITGGSTLTIRRTLRIKLDSNPPIAITNPDENEVILRMEVSKEPAFKYSIQELPCEELGGKYVQAGTGCEKDVVTTEPKDARYTFIAKLVSETNGETISVVEKKPGVGDQNFYVYWPIRYSPVYYNRDRVVVPNSQTQMKVVGPKINIGSDGQIQIIPAIKYSIKSDSYESCYTTGANPKNPEYNGSVTRICSEIYDFNVSIVPANIEYNLIVKDSSGSVYTSRVGIGDQNFTVKYPLETLSETPPSLHAEIEPIGK